MAKDKEKCATPFCRNKRAIHKKCSKCRDRQQKINNPISYTYSVLKKNAKRRGKNFTLTMEEFKIFCTETNYIELKGIGKNNYSIDRIDPLKGYETGNIRIVTVSENSRKRHIDYKGRGTGDVYANNKDLPEGDPEHIPF